MAFTLPDGKVARTLTEQVKFLTEKLKDLYAAVNNMGITIVKVDSLPDEGEPRTIYLVPVISPDQDNYYEEYIWYDDAWELIGTTQIDLSGYVTLDTNQTITGAKTMNKVDLGFSSLVNDINYFYVERNSDQSQIFKADENAIYVTNIDLTGSIDFGNSTYINKDAYNGIDFYINNNAKLVIREAITYLNNNFYPLTTGTRDLGSSDLKWKDLYLSGTAYLGAELDLKDTYSYKLISDGAYLTIKRDTVSIVQFYDSLIQPYTNNTVDLGTSSKKWKDLYLSGKITNGTNEITFDQYSSIVLGNTSGYPVISGGGLQPRYTEVYDFGASSRLWKNIWLSGEIKDGTNSVTVADIAALITYAKAQGWIS